MRRLLLIACLCAAASGCSDADDSAANNAVIDDELADDTGNDVVVADMSDSVDMGVAEPDASADDAGTEPGFTLPAWDDLEAGWNEVYPGGDTACALGQEYSFYIYKGDPTKLTVHYFGGGGCWNEATCAGDVYTDDLTGLRAQIDAGERPGVFDMENPANPVAGWTHLVVPYCTGDVHWGDNVVEYGVGTVIHHKGAVNARSVFEFADRELPDVEDVFVQGCSAGAYGATLWAPHFMQRYPNATQTMFADSGAGVITDNFFQNSFPNWKAEGVFPSWIPALDPMTADIYGLTMTDLYGAIGAAYPDSVLSQWNTEGDETQTLFYTLMGGMGDQMGWSLEMYALTHGIVASTPNYRNWTAPGESHCILPYDSFFTHETNGVKLVDWLTAMLEREETTHVTCVDCQPPP